MEEKPLKEKFDVGLELQLYLIEIAHVQSLLLAELNWYQYINYNNI